MDTDEARAIILEKLTQILLKKTNPKEVRAQLVDAVFGSRPAPLIPFDDGVSNWSH